MTSASKMKTLEKRYPQRRSSSFDVFSAASNGPLIKKFTCTEKGDGMYSTVGFDVRDVIAEYQGNWCSVAEGEVKEKEYEDKGIGCFSFTNGSEYFDVNFGSENKGRFINHSKRGNAKLP